MWHLVVLTIVATPFALIARWAYRRTTRKP